MGEMDYLIHAVGKIVYPINFNNNFISIFKKVSLISIKGLSVKC